MNERVPHLVLLSQTECLLRLGIQLLRNSRSRGGAVNSIQSC